jgi:hypothetical protein
VELSAVKWSEALRNRVSIIIRRCTDHMKFYCFFHILLFLMCFIVHMVVCFVCFYWILHIMYSFWYVHVFLLFYIYIYNNKNTWTLGIVFHYVVLCIVCVWMCTVLLPPSGNPIAVNEYI